MRAFLASTAKLVAVLVCSCIVLSLLGWAAYVLIESREGVRNAPLAVAKVWPTDSIPSISGAAVSLSTKWRNGVMSYKFEVTGIGRDFAERLEKEGTSKIGFSLLLF